MRNGWKCGRYMEEHRRPHFGRRMKVVGDWIHPTSPVGEVFWRGYSRAGKRWIGLRLDSGEVIFTSPAFVQAA